MKSDVPDETIFKEQAERRQLQEIIAGLGEGIVLIDPAEGIVWANQQALALHDATELSDIGASAADYRKRFVLRYRNNHMLTPDQYPIDRLLSGETFDDITVEVTKVSAKAESSWRCVQQLRGIALTDRNGKAESFALVIQDVTERFTAEERFERTFNANPAPAIICRLSDLRYVKVNQGFLEMTGYAAPQVLGRTTYEIDVLEAASNKSEAITSLREGKTIPQTEANLRLPDGGTKLAIVAGQPIEIGDEPCMLFTFMDMESRRKAEEALRQSEERFARSFRLAPIPTLLVARKDCRIVDVNDAFISALGYGEEEAIGRTAMELPIWVSSAARRELEREVEKTGDFRDMEMQFRTKREEILDVLLSAGTVSIHAQECVLIVLQDITERKRSEVELIAAIEAVMQDTSWFSHTVIEKLASLRHPGKSNKASAGLSVLTDREKDVLGLMCQGLSDAEIVKTLNLTRNTVRNHAARIYNKTGVHSRTAAVVWARERGFTGPASRKNAASRQDT